MFEIDVQELEGKHVVILHISGREFIGPRFLSKEEAEREVLRLNETTRGLFDRRRKKKKAKK